MQRFGNQKQKASMNVGLYAASFTQPISERQRELSLKDKDSSLLHMIET